MEKLLTRKEAARLLGISIATLDAARTNGLVSFVQYCENAQGETEGNQYRYHLQESEKRCAKVTSLSGCRTI